MMQPSTRVRGGWRVACLTVCLLGAACLLSTGSTGWLPGAFSTAVRPGRASTQPLMAEKGGKLANQQYVEGETNIWTKARTDEDKANIAKADQARKEFDMRNGKQTWYGPMGKKEEQVSSKSDMGMAGNYMNRAGMYGAQDDMRAKAAQQRAEFMARNGMEEWYDVTRGARVEELSSAVAASRSPAVAAAAPAAPAAAAPELTANQKEAYK